MIDLKPRSWIRRASIADIAGHKDVLALFSYTVGEDGAHTSCQSFAAAAAWRGVADCIASVGRCAADDQHVRVVLGGAVCFYARSKTHALVAVLPHKAAFIKSVHRTFGRALLALTKGAT